MSKQARWVSIAKNEYGKLVKKWIIVTRDGKKYAQI